MSNRVLNRMSLVVVIVGPLFVIGPMFDTVNPRGPDMEMAVATAAAWLVYLWSRPIKPARPPSS
jgi:hypothetical protein